MKSEEKNSCLKCGKQTNRIKYCSRECYLERNFREASDGSIEKRCSKCKQYKPRDVVHFCLNPRNTRDGLHSHCKTCASTMAKTPHTREIVAASRLRRAGKIHTYNKERNSLPEVRAKNNANERARKRVDPAFALKNRVRVLMYHTLRHVKAGRKWQDLVAYSIDDLRQHIEKLFIKGMTWDLFMQGQIHIDHIIPITAFNYTEPQDIDFKKCWALKNLRPMWALDNIRKGNSLCKPFQPSLCINM